MIIVQRPSVNVINHIDPKFRYGFYIVSGEYDLGIELYIVNSELIKDTDDRPISNQGQDIR